jgi:hypothetical protein
MTTGAQHPQDLTSAHDRIGRELERIDANHAIGGRVRQPGVGKIANREADAFVELEQAGSGLGLGYRNGRGVNPGQDGTGFPRQPHPRTAAAARQINQCFARPQLQRGSHLA